MRWSRGILHLSSRGLQGLGLGSTCYDTWVLGAAAVLQHRRRALYLSRCVPLVSVLKSHQHLGLRGEHGVGIVQLLLQIHDALSQPCVFVHLTLPPRRHARAVGGEARLHLRTHAGTCRIVIVPGRW